MAIESSSSELSSLITKRHLRFGWWSMLCFVSLGIMLEAMHGLKIGWYLEPAYETRRLMWTLGHAHGTLLALVHIALGVTVLATGSLTNSIRWASPCLMGATFLLPGGFFLGGIYFYDGDPGLGIFLVPVGALCMFAAVFLIATGVTRADDEESNISGDKSSKKRSRKK